MRSGRLEPGECTLAGIDAEQLLGAGVVRLLIVPNAQVGFHAGGGCGALRSGGRPRGQLRRPSCGALAWPCERRRTMLLRLLDLVQLMPQRVFFSRQGKNLPADDSAI